MFSVVIRQSEEYMTITFAETLRDNQSIQRGKDQNTIWR